MTTGMNGQQIVTTSILKNMLQTGNIEQVNHMQLFVVDNIYLYSYRTLIGVFVDSVWCITTKKYSSTTNRQILKFSRLVGYANIKRIDQDQLEQLIDMQ
jgi:hypothetical protein